MLAVLRLVCRRFDSNCHLHEVLVQDICERTCLHRRLDTFRQWFDLKICNHYAFGGCTVTNAASANPLAVFTALSTYA